MFPGSPSSGTLKSQKVGKPSRKCYDNMLY